MPTAFLVEGRFTVVDALRGIAALGVVIFHLFAADHVPQLKALLPRWLAAALDHGDLGVAIFFVLSGFVIAHSLFNKHVTSGLAGRFMLRRSIRLDPPYWLAIAAALLFAVISSMVLPDKARAVVSWQQIVAHLFYLQDILGFSEINPVFWTLCLEAQFYLVYALLLVLARGDMRLTPLILISAMLISLLWPTGIVSTGLWRGSFLPLWHGFLLGSAAYWAWRYPQFAFAFVLFALLVLTFSTWRGDAFSVTCALTACVLWVSAISGRIFTGLNWRWLQFLGLISYSLYLIHNQITGATFRIGYMLTAHGIWSEIFWLTAVLGACITAAAGMWWLIERPSIRFARTVSMAKAQNATPGIRTLGKPEMVRP